MNYQRGEIVLVPFPFTDLSRQKARPAIVVSPDSFNRRSPDVILAAISSQVPETPDEFELVIEQGYPDFGGTGLRVASVIKSSKLVTLKKSLIYTKLGKLTDLVMQELDSRLIQAVGVKNYPDEQ